MIVLLLLLHWAAAAVDQMPRRRQNEEQSRRRHLVFGGTAAVQNRYPYFTRIQLKDNFQTCGGTLIASDMVLTNPYCNIPLSDTVDVGFYSVDESNLEGQSFGVSQVFVHPAYSSDTARHAFMAIKLNGTSEQAFPRLNMDATVPTVDTPLSVAGIGNFQDDEPGFRETTLQEALVDFVPTETCERTKTANGQPYLGILDDDSMFCMGNAQRNACEDDWGGPIVQRGDGDPSDDTLVGVFSWSYGCGTEGSANPSVAARVSSGYEWIRFILCANAAQPPTYLDCDSGFTEPNFPVPTTPSKPANPILFSFTFASDDYSFENAYTLERLDGLSTVLVDYVVPNGFPFETTSERNITLQEGALYFWQITDSSGDGLSVNDGGAKLYLQGSSGVKSEIWAEDEIFSGAIGQVFYASLGPVENSIFTTASIEGGTFINMVIHFDDYPWEFGFTLATSDGELLFYRPPRFYYRRAGDNVTETIPVPAVEISYVLTVVDTCGDGFLGDSTGYTLVDAEENVIVESQFRDTDKEEKTFVYTAPLLPSGAIQPSPYHVAMLGITTTVWSLVLTYS